MNKKPELLVPAGTVAEAEAYFRSGADAVVVGHERYALRLPGSMELEDIAQAVRSARLLDKRVYAAVTALLHEFTMDDLESYVRGLGDIGIDGIVYGDPAVLMAARRAAPGVKLHWNTETTSTNYRTVNFWAKRGAARAVLARELSLTEVLEAKRNTEVEIEVQVQGMTCIFHSKRELVSSFLEHRGLETDADGKRRTFLREEKRGEDHQYPILEDLHGTHIMSDEDLCMIGHLRRLMDAGIDALKIETLLRSVAENERIIAIYRNAVDTMFANPLADPDPAWESELAELEPADRHLGTGFYFKEQIY